MPAKKTTKKKAASSSRNSASGKFTAEERAAMRQRAKELKAEAAKADGKKALMDAIAEMPPKERTMAKRLDALIMSTAPELEQKTWYGMPAYAKDGKVLCFFQNAGKFKSRYATFGFSDEANLDKGGMWPTSFALMELTPTEEKEIGALVKKAAG